MNLTALQKRIHYILEKDSNTPTSTEEDYLVRLELICDAVGIWEHDNENGTQWKELFVSLADVDSNVDTDADKVTVVGQSVYTCPLDFVFPVSFIKIGTGDSAVYYRKIEPTEVDAYESTTEDVYYITGNRKVGYKIHLMHTIPSAVLDINYDYYKTAFLPTTGTDVLEMEDEQFAIYWVLSELTKDDDPGLSSTYTQIAINKLDGMRLKNEQVSNYQYNEIVDTNPGF